MMKTVDLVGTVVITVQRRQDDDHRFPPHWFFVFYYYYYYYYYHCDYYGFDHLLPFVHPNFHGRAIAAYFHPRQQQRCCHGLDQYHY
jgi:hypothetical protein